ncbi:ATP-dependent protease LonB [Candidatus Woesearchaeota archaeon]|nr:ATP-dependent protease LonB [Candidatus Woesearchaeota archaeon]
MVNKKIIKTKTTESKIINKSSKKEVKLLNYKTTADILIPKNISEQIIGQDEGLQIIKKAGKQRRNVLLIGEPGTGKSLLGQAIAEQIPTTKLVDVLCFPNDQDENNPLIRVLPRGKGKDLITKLKIQSIASSRNINILLFIILIITLITPWWIRKQYGDIIAAASIIGSMIFLVGFLIFININKKLGNQKIKTPKLLVDTSSQKTAPFIDATGMHAGALLGDCLHDPLQTGGLGTPAHERVTPGAIHKANNGVLFIDEIGLLDPHSQQELLTTLQEKKYKITGQSERSSGAMVATEPVPCDFILAAAGNLETVEKMHPALRSRIRGYGYEVYMNETMEDNQENRNKIVKFVAQEVAKDKKIPHFTKEAVEEIIQEARKMAGISGKLTVRLRELGGLVRAAGDVASEYNSKLVEREHILKAKQFARPLEQQLADKYIENKKKYEVIITEGSRVGRINGLAVIGSGAALSGLVLPIESEITPGGEKEEFVATGQLGEIAKEAVKNVSAIILKYFGEDIKEKHDIFIQFLYTAGSGVEGDSASIAVATAIVSALKKIPIRQDTAMTGSLSIRGEVLPIGGVTAKVEAAIEAGIKNVIVPKGNHHDIILSKETMQKVKIIPVETFNEVLKNALVWKDKDKKILNKLMKKY